MNKLMDILSEQKKSLLNNGDGKEDYSNEFTTIVKFDIGTNHYAIDIKYVNEIVDSLHIAPYPEKLKHHIGITNIRGQIMPVVDLNENYNIKNSDNIKIIAIQFSSYKTFAIRVEKVQKFIYNLSALKINKIISLNNTPTFFLEEEDFNNLLSDTL